MIKTTVPVLMYHHISPEPGLVTCSPEHFEDQLAWLHRRGYHSLTTQQFAAHLAGKPTPKRSVLITFDDGYLDNWKYAYPLLKKYGFNAVLFIVTAWIGDGEPRAVAHTPSQREGLPEIYSHDACMTAIQQGLSDDVMLRWSEVRHLEDEGVFEFHSHTHTHTRWDLAPDATLKNQRMHEELEQSRASLVHNLGEASEHLCWPQGYFDKDYIAIAKEHGFRYLYTTQAFGQNQPGSDPLRIYRFAVRNTTGASTGRRVRVAANPVIAPVFNGFKRWKRGRRAAKSAS